MGSCRKADMSFLGWKHTPETKKKASEALKKAWQKPERLKRHLEIHIGRKLSEENKRKISQANKGHKYLVGYKHSEESKQNMSKAWKGKPGPFISTKAKAKISKAKKKWWTPERKQIQVEKMTGSNSPMWQGGLNLPYGSGWTDKLKESIRQRDNYRCQNGTCKKKPQKKDKLEVHHINWDKTNHEHSNLISVCTSCHMSIHRKSQKMIRRKPA